jgi:hypothetical protein
MNGAKTKAIQGSLEEEQQYNRVFDMHSCR